MNKLRHLLKQKNQIRVWAVAEQDQIIKSYIKIFNEKDRLGLKKINIIPINIGEEEYEKSKIFFDELGIDNLEIFSGPSGDLAKKFKLRGVPTTIIIDKEGHEISRILGSIDFLDKQFLEWLKSIVNS